MGTETTASKTPEDQGATISTIYHKRVQEYVAVNRSDLDDLLEFDASEQVFNVAGMFLLFGAGLLSVEKLLEQGDAFRMTPLLWSCLVFVL